MQTFKRGKRESQVLIDYGRPSIENNFLLQESKSTIEKEIDSKGLIDRLIQSKDMRLLKKQEQKDTIQLLNAVETHIVHEVISLATDINQLKENIVEEKRSITELEAKLPHNADELNYLDFNTGRATEAQLNSLLADNQAMSEQLQNLSRGKQMSGRSTTLRQQQSIHNELTNRLKEGDFLIMENGGNNSEQLRTLRSKVNTLKRQLNSSGVDNNDERYSVEYFKSQNSELRNKTLEVLKLRESAYKENEAEHDRLIVYLEEEEKQRLLLLKDIEVFNSQLKALEKENRQLRDKVENRENIRTINEFKIEKNTGTGRRTNKYENLVSEISTLMEK